MTLKEAFPEVAAPPEESLGCDLNRAADLIARGWTQGTYQVGDSFCLVGAMRRATAYRQARYMRMQQKVNQVLFGRSTFSTAMLTAWNDNCDRTQEEVVALLRKAAKAS